MISQSEYAAIAASVAEVLEVDVSELHEDTNFIDDLGADSLSLIEVLSRVEKMLSITIDQSQLARMTSLHEVCQVVSEARQLVA
ncbi:MAG TPA: acyl carrier protein [Rhodopila sp.]|jgi:acyl carrier protein|nr:acyl carrier protein [Rhodopila sp.]